MIIYEVNISLENQIFNDYLTWLDEHVKEVLSCPGFLASRIFIEEQGEINSLDNKKIIVVQYEVESNEYLQSYLQNHANLLRQQALDRFGSQFSAMRRVLQFEKSISLVNHVEFDSA